MIKIMDNHHSKTLDTKNFKNTPTKFGYKDSPSLLNKNRRITRSAAQKLKISPLKSLKTPRFNRF